MQRNIQVVILRLTTRERARSTGKKDHGSLFILLQAYISNDQIRNDPHAHLSILRVSGSAYLQIRDDNTAPSLCCPFTLRMVVLHFAAVAGIFSLRLSVSAYSLITL